MTTPFAKALSAEMEHRGISQSQLAPRLGVSQPTLSNWCAGRYVPDATSVFAIEHELGLVPGQLSRHLGYLPLGAKEVPWTVIEAIAASGEPEWKRRAATEVWAALVADSSKGARPSRTKAS